MKDFKINSTCCELLEHRFGMLKAFVRSVGCKMVKRLMEALFNLFRCFKRIARVIPPRSVFVLL